MLPPQADFAAADYLLTGLLSPSRIGRHVPKGKPTIPVLDYKFVLDAAEQGTRPDASKYEIKVPNEYRPDTKLVTAGEAVKAWVGGIAKGHFLISILTFLLASHRPNQIPISFMNWARALRP